MVLVPAPPDLRKVAPAALLNLLTAPALCEMSASHCRSRSAPALLLIVALSPTRKLPPLYTPVPPSRSSVTPPNDLLPAPEKLNPLLRFNVNAPLIVSAADA